MKGCIYYKTKHGSAKQYAEWLSQETGYEMKDIRKGAKPGEESVVIVASSIMMGKLSASGWMKKNWQTTKDRHVIMLVVGGAKIGSKERSDAMQKSLTGEMLQNSRVFHLGGRFDPATANFFLSKMLKMAMKEEKDPDVKKAWLGGFDDVKKESLEPVIKYIKSL